MSELLSTMKEAIEQKDREIITIEEQLKTEKKAKKRLMKMYAQLSEEKVEIKEEEKNV